MRAVVAIFVLLFVLRADAKPGDDARAREYYSLGVREFERGEYLAALRQFDAADKIAPRAEVHYNIALCLEKLGRFPEAVERYRAYQRAAPNAANLDEVASAIETLERLEAQRTALAAQQAVVAAPPPPEPPPVSWPRRHRASLVVGAITVATFAAMIGTGVTAQGKFDDARCNDRTKQCADTGALDSSHRLAIATDALLGVGVAAAAVTVVLFVLEVKLPHRLALHANGVSIGASF